MSSCFASGKKESIPITLIEPKTYKTWLGKQSAFTKNWLESTGFDASTGAFALIPDSKGVLASVLLVAEKPHHVWTIAHLPEKLPASNYALTDSFTRDIATQICVGWQLGSYRFTKYKANKKPLATLTPPEAADLKEAKNIAGAISLTRDLINTPAGDMLPDQLALEAERVGKANKATVTIIRGEALLKENYPTIYTVGKASASEPRLVDMRWGNPKHPKITLVGKGVCFDSGGLDIKGSGNMRLMKKDMGGAAMVLGLAGLLMQQKLPIRLRVLLPIVENAIAGNAMRPLDIVKTRKGITVEIGNTDAEGRLILCDALYEADLESPDLLIDCATLTGAARVALGTDIPAYFTADDQLAALLDVHALTAHDPLYRLPLWEPYRELLNSSVADISNNPDSGYGGAISAALYLKEFVANTESWLHIDMMAWNLRAKPGRPIGGEAQALRTLYGLIKEQYGRS